MKNIAAKLCKGMMVVFLFYLSGVQAEESKAIDCSVEPYQGQLFIELYKTTQQTAQNFCKQLIRSRIDQNTIDNAFVGSILKDFASTSKTSLDELKLMQSADYNAQFSQLMSDFGNFNFANMKMPEFKVGGSIIGGARAYFEPLSNKVDRIDIEEVDHCASLSTGASCKDVFKDFANAFNPYRSAYNNVYDNSKELTTLGNRWDDFLEVSKSQTALEVFLTTWAHKDHFQKNHLVGPPSYQVIALHPHAIYDSMDKAVDGSNEELGLAIEWIGVNFWDLKLPLGISFASAYVDRAGAQDTGHGVMLHINNHYAIGWAKHAGDSSVYVTIDLLKLFEEKKDKYDTYMNYYY